MKTKITWKWLLSQGERDAQRYERAVRIIEEKGWSKHQFRNAQGNVCLVQAVADAGIGPGNFMPVVDAILNNAQRHPFEYRRPRHYAWTWNDMYAENDTEVKHILHEAAREARR